MSAASSPLTTRKSATAISSTARPPNTSTKLPARRIRSAATRFSGSAWEGQEGDFKIVFRGQTTDDIPWGADPGVVEKELKSLSAIGPTGVANVERFFGFFEVSYQWEFTGPLAATNIGPVLGIQGTKQLSNGGGGADVRRLGRAAEVVDGGNNNPVLVEAHLTGLTPGAIYHYQVFATNSLGTVGSGDASFIAPFAAEDEPCPNEEVRDRERLHQAARMPRLRAGDVRLQGELPGDARRDERQRRHGLLLVQGGEHQQLRLGGWKMATSPPVATAAGKR